VPEDRYKYFRLEAREILDQLGQGVLDIEKGGQEAEAIARLLRLAHTLKGAARVVTQREIADCAHALEDVLGPSRGGSSPVPRESIDRLFSLVDEIAHRVAQLPQPGGPGAPGPAERSEPQPLPGFRPAMDDVDALLAGLFEAHVRVSALRPKLAQVQRTRAVATLVVDQLTRSRDTETVQTAGNAQSEKIRSTAEDLRGMFSALERDLASNIDQLDRELRQVGEAAERLRLTPASALFTFLERAVRDVAHALGKPVVFEAHGGDVRVDAVVLNVVQGALLHVVRNAVAHGIEPGEAERRAAGKPTEGRVTLRISQRGRSVSFACTDDGRGIDLAAVGRMAAQKGLAPQEADRDGLLRALLQGGISTAREVTDVSGRGIGLDVVREAAERFGGEATLRTESGTGTTVELEVPLSVASFRALIVESSGKALAIPLDAVRASLRIAREDVARTAQGESVLVDGRAVPLASMPDGVSSAPPSNRSGRVSSAVVVQGRSGVAAFRVDRVIDTANIVMRPLPDLAPAPPIVAGTTLDASGDPFLVFDPDHLVSSAQRGGTVAIAAAPPPVSILVVDDSLTTRMLEQSILESAGYLVELATSGEEGLRKARAAGYALILVDVEMPGMDGFTFIEHVRADAELQRIPAILVTSRNAPEDRERGRAVGAQDYVVKSEFDQGVLLERIRTLVA
jgi:two-component system chemotaxis sensor kinase CheA